MDTQSLPPEERVALYQERARKLRQMANAEQDRTARDRMLALAMQYQRLAGELKRLPRHDSAAA